MGAPLEAGSDLEEGGEGLLRDLLGLVARQTRPASGAHHLRQVELDDASQGLGIAAPDRCRQLVSSRIAPLGGRLLASFADLGGVAVHGSSSTQDLEQ